MLYCASAISAQETADSSVEDSIDKLYKASQRQAPLVDRAQFELEALLEKRDYDADSIVAFVSQHIAVDIYPGTLRGPLGTLTGRAGNSLDQALLTATLLRDAGYDAVIRRGTLDDEHVTQLLELMFAKRNLNISPWTSTADGAGSEPDPERAQRRSLWVDAAKAQASQLEKSLSSAGIQNDPGPLVSELRQDAADYYWVDYREGVTDPWISVHPALGSDPGVATLQTFAKTIPNDLIQRVRLEVFVDQRLGNSIVSNLMFDPIELVGPELTGMTLQVTLLPDQLLNRNAPLDPDQLADNTNFILPIVNGGMPRGAMALSPQGNLVPVDALAMGNAEYFDTVSQKSTQAIDALAGIGSADGDNTGSQVQLKAIRLKTTFISPGKADRVAERDWFSASRDLGHNGADADHQKRALVMAVARSHDISFATAAQNNALLMETINEQVNAMYALLRATDGIDGSDCNTLSCFTDIKWTPPDAGLAANPLFLAFDDIDADLKPGSVRYRHLPGMFIQSRPQLSLPGQSPGLGLRLDIVSNAKRAFAINEKGVQADRWTQYLGGTWETLIETDVYSRTGEASPPSESARKQLNQFTETTQLGKTPASPVAVGIQRDLNAGYAVFVAADFTIASADPGSRWWRVDPISGETLGMNQFGGAEAFEYGMLIVIAVDLIASISSAALAIYCVENSSHRAPEGKRVSNCLQCTNVLTGSFNLAVAAVKAISADSMDSTGYFFRENNALHKRCMAR
jgi:hypothetical protein